MQESEVHFELIEINIHTSDRTDVEMLRELIASIGSIARKYGKKTLPRTGEDKVTVVILES